MIMQHIFSEGLNLHFNHQGPVRVSPILRKRSPLGERRRYRSSREPDGFFRRKRTAKKTGLNPVFFAGEP